MENAPQTEEGAALWRLLQGPGGWAGGGLTPLRLDRAVLLSRLPADEAWIHQDLLDAFEGGVLEAQAAEKEKPDGG